jgi:hypothetical protein
MRLFQFLIYKAIVYHYVIVRENNGIVLTLVFVKDSVIDLWKSVLVLNRTFNVDFKLEWLLYVKLKVLDKIHVLY